MALRATSVQAPSTHRVSHPKGGEATSLSGRALRDLADLLSLTRGAGGSALRSSKPWDSKRFGGVQVPRRQVPPVTRDGCSLVPRATHTTRPITSLHGRGLGVSKAPSGINFPIGFRVCLGATHQFAKMITSDWIRSSASVCIYGCIHSYYSLLFKYY